MTIDAPYLAQYRAWEDEGQEAEWIAERSIQISEEILGDRKWDDYPQITERVCQHVSDQAFDEAPRLVEALWYAHARWASAEQKAQALEWLKQFAALIDDAFREEVEAAAEQELRDKQVEVDDEP